MPVNRGVVTRRLAAILIADVVGFSRHMERDDAGTLAKLREVRERLIDPKIAEYGGHVVKTAGDGMLLEFGSADAALRCAIDVQRAMAADNQSRPPDERLEFRMGINLGDIIVDGTDIAGDGVNVAARLEGLAQAGGICISSAVREQVHGGVDIRFDDIGEQQVKNIMRPIRVYQVMLGGDAPDVGAHPHEPLRASPRRIKPWQKFALAALAALVALPVLWLVVGRSKPVTSAADSPPALSVAILPFAPASDSGADRQFAEEVTSDVAAGMGRRHDVTVRAARIESSAKAKSIDMPAAGHELNVRYFADGELRRPGNKVALAARLTDASSRKQVWSDRFEFEASALAANPDTLQLQVTRRLRRALLGAEIKRVAGDSAATRPMDVVLRGFAIWNSEVDVKGPRAARKYFEDALRLEPDFVPALCGLSDSYESELEFGPNAEHALFEQKMDALTGRAVNIDFNDAAAWFSRAAALSWLGRWDEALAATERAESLDPSMIDPLLWRSWIMISTGRPIDSLALAQRAAAMDPPGNGWPQLMACKSYLYLGRYDEAVAACEKSAGLNNSWVDQVYLTAAYGQKGDLVKAKIARQELLKLQPNYTIERYRRTWYSGTPAFFDLVERHLAAGLRKAGIPDT
jgi:Adenylate cyclase, family 3 (some proteins contain HAMP domain)